MSLRSPLARTPAGHDPRRGLARIRQATARYVVHQTGSGIVSKALRAERRGTAAEAVDAAAIAYYTSRPLSVHYFIGLDGRIWLLTHEAVRVPHVGVGAAERSAYRTGAWLRGARPRARRVRAIAPAAIAAWRSHWPRYRSPVHLYPATSINDCSIGSEMAPAGYYAAGGWRALPGVLPWLGGRHTLAQHLAVAALAVDIAARHSWPDGWQHDALGGPRSPYVLGHEDVDLFGRADDGGGWDPGALRAEPRFDWQLVHGAIVGLLAGGQLADFVCRALGIRRGELVS